MANAKTAGQLYNINSPSLCIKLALVAKALQAFEADVPDYDGDSADRKVDTPESLSNIRKRARTLRGYIEGLMKSVDRVVDECHESFEDRSNWRWNR